MKRSAAAPVLDRPELGLVGTWVRALSIRSRLLSWFDQHRRDMPWRRDRSPYGVVVSEVMLQQTRVEVATPYFERWVARWPSFAALAAAEESEVLAMWSGLGYYRRARYLHAIAKRSVAEFGGTLPADPAALREFPGIGEYTAHAVASIVFGIPVAVVDGNVERVLCRILCLQDDPGRARDRVVAEGARRIVTMLLGEDPAAIEPPEGLRPGDVNQALMELGSLVCLPAEPRCHACPVARSCIANRAGLASKVPVKAEKRPTRDVVLRSAVLRRDGSVLLVKRPDGRLMGGLWELPTAAEGAPRRALESLVRAFAGPSASLPKRPARTFGHSITHRRITVHVYECETPACAVGEPRGDVAWVAAADLPRYAVSSITTKALRTPRR